MKILIANTYQCCHENEFLGVFKTEEDAKYFALEKTKMEWDIEDNNSGDRRVWLELDDRCIGKDYNEYELMVQNKIEDEIEIFSGNMYYKIQDLVVQEVNREKIEW